MTPIGSFFSGMNSVFGYVDSQHARMKLFRALPVISFLTSIGMLVMAHEARLAGRVASDLNEKCTKYGEAVALVIQGILYFLQVGLLAQLFIDLPVAAYDRYAARNPASQNETN